MGKIKVGFKITQKKQKNYELVLFVSLILIWLRTITSLHFLPLIYYLFLLNRFLSSWIRSMLMYKGCKNHDWRLVARGLSVIQKDCSIIRRSYKSHNIKWKLMSTIQEDLHCNTILPGFWSMFIQYSSGWKGSIKNGTSLTASSRFFFWMDTS